MISLLDNTVMSNFTVIQQPVLLRAAFDDQLATPRAAFAELRRGVQSGRLAEVDWEWLPVWTLTDVEISYYDGFLQRLNAGEAACLAIALERRCRVLTDDRDAREIARRLQIPLSGTLGVLVRLIDIEHLTLDKADHLLTKMIAAGYRSPIASLRHIL
jgi:hypothetical protein